MSSRTGVALTTRGAFALAALALAATCTPFGSDSEGGDSGASDSGAVDSGASDSGAIDSGADGSADAADAVGPVLVREGVSTGSSTTTLTVTLPSRPADGHALVLVVGSNKDYPAAVAGGGVKSWINPALSGLHVATSIWVGLGVSSATSDVTITWAVQQPTAVALLTEWAGLSALESAGVLANGSTATPTAAPFAAQPGQLLFAAAGTQRLAASPMGGFSPVATIASSGSVNVVGAYLNVGSAGMHGTSWTMSAPAGWDTALVALR